MNLFEKIEHIIFNERLNTTEFLEKTGVSRTSYYSLKSGETSTLNNKTLRKITNAFPSYSMDWLLGDSVIEQKKNTAEEPTPLYGDIPLDHLAFLAVKNWDILIKKNSAFRLKRNEDVNEKVIERLTSILAQTKVNH